MKKFVAATLLAVALLGPLAAASAGAQSSTAEGDPGATLAAKGHAEAAAVQSQAAAVQAKAAALRAAVGAVPPA